jgi:hypothetical protein
VRVEKVNFFDRTRKIEKRKNTNKPAQQHVRICTRTNPALHHSRQCGTNTLLCNLQLAREPHISLPIPILKPMLLPIPKRTLMPRIVVLPRLISILERNWIGIPTLCLNLHGIRQMTSQTQRLTAPIDRLLLRQSNNLLCRIIHDNIKRVVRANAVFITLVLYNVHSAPAGSEARGWIHGLEDAKAESRGADLGDAAGVFDAAERSFLLFAEFAVLSVSGFVDEALDVEVFPVVEVFEAENGVV